MFGFKHCFAQGVALWTPKERHGDPIPMNSSILTDEDVAFLASLEAQLTAEAADGRTHPRLDVGLAFSIKPASASQQQDPAQPGRTLDLSLGGLRGNMSRPLSIGDHYRVCITETEDASVEITARCLRCAFIDEQRFEVVLRFSSTLDESALPVFKSHR